jgi:hypothetical protein
MIEQMKKLQYQRGKIKKSVGKSVYRFELVKCRHFKGLRKEETYSHVRLHFRSFQEYEDVKRVLSQFNR